VECRRCKLIRWGKHRNGTPRWKCCVCGRTRSREKSRLAYGLIKKYLIDGDTCHQLAGTYRVHPDTVRRKISRAFNQAPPILSPIIPEPCWLITDATHFKHWGCLFVTKATGVKHPLAVSFHYKECFESAIEHLKPLGKLAVTGYTTDGKKGLVLAHKMLFPEARGQRCLVHIQMRVGTLLTTSPKLLAGRELAELVKRLPTVKTTVGAQPLVGSI